MLDIWLVNLRQSFGLDYVSYAGKLSLHIFGQRPQFGFSYWQYSYLPHFYTKKDISVQAL